MASLDTYVELCAASFAVGLSIGYNVDPVVTVQGSKRGFRSIILSSCGLEPGAGFGRALAVEPGPFGDAWQVWRQPAARAAAVAQLEKYSLEDPLTIFNRVAKAPIAADLVQRVADWSMLQFWSWGGKPVYPKPIDPNQLTMFGPLPRRWKTHGMDKADAYNSSYRAARGDSKTTWRDIRLPDLIGQIESLPDLSRLEVAQCSALEIDPLQWGGPGTLVVIDPPYEGTEGYGPYVLRRLEVLELARRWAATGARVVVCEAVPLVDQLRAGWWAVRIDGEIEGRGRNNYGACPEWLTCSFRPEGWESADLLDGAALAA